ncbi:MAG: histidine phosphatase family protein [Oscillospiraceae bacterium]|nr:histidine phosphatase family protein [Oscillospiraceae bacterium]
MEFYIVRHGRTNNNDLGIYNGCRSDEDLNAVGVAQAEQTRDALRDTALDLIVCSPLRRAKHTAAIIGEGRDLPVVYDERLRERDMGALTGKPFLKSQVGDASAEYGVETIESLCARVRAALDDIRANYEGKRVLIVSHGVAAKAICAYFEGMPEDGTLRPIPLLDNCEVRKYSL